MKKAKRVLMNIKPADFVEKNGEVAFVKMYGNVLESHNEAFRAVFERLKDVQAEGGILFHCTAGKDRTGVLAAPILGIVGASEDEIAEDYALTRIGVEPFRNHLVGTLLKQMAKSEEDGINEPGMEELCGVRGQTILAFLHWMNGKWGAGGAISDSTTYPGVEGYLRLELKFTEDDIYNIRTRLRAAKA
jgi:hypothetical protein